MGSDAQLASWGNYTWGFLRGNDRIMSTGGKFLRWVTECPDVFLSDGCHEFSCMGVNISLGKFARMSGERIAGRGLFGEGKFSGRYFFTGEMCGRVCPVEIVPDGYPDTLARLQQLCYVQRL